MPELATLRVYYLHGFVDPDDIRIPFDYQYKNICDGCIHDDERKVCRSCGSPDLHQFGLCCDCVDLADISEQCMLSRLL